MNEHLTDHRRPTLNDMSQTTPAWDSPDLFPTSDAKRVARYRRLQSWYRAVQLGVEAGTSGNYPALGSYLHADAVAAQRDLNFLHPAAHEHAETRALKVQDEGGSLEPKRLFHNMLSSMPMCFNLFGAMRGEHTAFLPVFQKLFDSEATAITEIVCEWAPADLAARIGDRTAFDAVILYVAGAEPRFVGIETKYTEAFSAEPYDRPQYRTLTADSDWFVDGADVELLKGPKANQLWRNTMLAAALEASGSKGTGRVAVVALADDSGAQAALEIVQPQMTAPASDHLRLVTIEDILSTAEKLAPQLSWWATSFRRRYVATDMPDNSSDQQDPRGPRFGRDLAATARLAASGQRD